MGEGLSTNRLQASLLRAEAGSHAAGELPRRRGPLIIETYALDLAERAKGCARPLATTGVRVGPLDALSPRGSLGSQTGMADRHAAAVTIWHFWGSGAKGSVPAHANGVPLPGKPRDGLRSIVGKPLFTGISGIGLLEAAAELDHAQHRPLLNRRLTKKRLNGALRLCQMISRDSVDHRAQVCLRCAAIYVHHRVRPGKGNKVISVWCKADELQ